VVEPIRENAAKLVGQPTSVAPSPPPINTSNKRPLGSMDESYCKEKGATTLQESLRRGYFGQGEVEDEYNQSGSQRVNRIATRQKKKHTPVAHVFQQQGSANEGQEIGTTASSTITKIAPAVALDQQSKPPMVAKERGGSKKTWLRPLQLTAVLRNNPLPSGPAPPLSADVQRSKQSIPSLARRPSTAMACSSTTSPRMRLSVPALSSIPYKDTLPIPSSNLDRRSRASTVSSMESKASVNNNAKDCDNFTQRTDFTQRTVGSSILFKDEELRRTAPDHPPPREDLPQLPSTATTITFPRPRSMSFGSYQDQKIVSPHEATDILFNLVSRFKNDGSPSTFRSAAPPLPHSQTTQRRTTTTSFSTYSHLSPMLTTPDLAKQMRGIRTTCTTLESILTYQSSSDGSSSFQTGTMNSSRAAAMSEVQSSQNHGGNHNNNNNNHLQSLIDGVLEDIEDLISQSADTSRECQSGSREGPPRRGNMVRSNSMSSVGSAHSKFQWPPKGPSNVDKSNSPSRKLRLLGAKLFSAEVEVDAQESPCPASKRRLAVAEAGASSSKQNISHQSNRVSQLDLTKKLASTFRTDLTVGQACIPLPKLDYQDLLQMRHQVYSRSNQVPETTLPPTIRVQRPLSETSRSSGTIGSPDSAVIQRAEVVKNRKSAASLMQLNGVLNKRGSTRTRVISTCSSVIYQEEEEQDCKRSPCTPNSTSFTTTTSSSLFGSERDHSRFWSSVKRNSFSTSYTEFSPLSFQHYSKEQKPVESTLSISSILQSEEETIDYDREAREAIQASREEYSDSEYVRQILSSKRKEEDGDGNDYVARDPNLAFSTSYSLYSTQNTAGSNRIPPRVTRNVYTTQWQDTIAAYHLSGGEATRSKEKINKEPSPNHHKRSH
jgi:hypothetical protein